MGSIIGFNEFKKLFSDGGMEITEGMYSDFEKYADLLCERSRQMNLTAITDAEGISLKHFYDSVYPFTLFDVPENARVIDVGTGAGFPSVPLKIYRRDVKLCLLDSLNKRVGFLSEVSQLLGLEAECIHGRAEEAGRFIKSGNEMREAFDIATARAVTRLPELCEYCMPFVKIGGVFAALKGRDGETELKEAENAIKLLGGRVELCRDYSLENGDRRYLIVIRKVSSTPAKYPRNAGQMKKNRL